MIRQLPQVQVQWSAVVELRAEGLQDAQEAEMPQGRGAEEEGRLSSPGLNLSLSHLRSEHLVGQPPDGWLATWTNDEG